MELGATICFGDIVKLHATSGFEDGAPAATLSFMEQSGKDQPLLVLPPKGAPADAKLMEAEFIVSPVRGEKQQAPGTPLTYKTPFTLCTTEVDKKSGKEVPYSLNNKVSGHKDGVTLQPAQVKGEMYLTFEKGETVAETTVHENDKEFQLVVVDSNRIRKTLNHPLAHFVKPKTAGAFVGCGVIKNSKPLIFSLTKIKKEDGKTQSYMKEAKLRRASMEVMEPAKMDELGRPDRIESDASEMEARSRHASLVSQPSTSVLGAPASPTAAATAPTPSSAEATTGSSSNTPAASEPVERSAPEREAEHSTAVLAEAATTTHEPLAALVEAVEAVKPAETAPTSDAAPTVAAAPVSEPLATAEAATPATETAKTVEMSVAPAETTSTAEVVISEAFTAVSEAPAPTTMTTVSSTAIEAEELDADVGNNRAMCVGGVKCSIM